MINLDNLINLLKGNLLNNATISGVSDFCVTPEKVTQKSAFISINSDQKKIEEAVKNGAFAVIFEKDCEIINNEVAFIKVDDLEFSIKRLILFFANNHKFVLLSEIQNDIFHYFSLPKNIIFASNYLDEFLIQVANAKPNSIFLCEKKEHEILNLPNITEISPNSNFEILFKNSIFFSNFIFDGIYYSNLNFPYFLLDELCGIIGFLKEKEINFKIQDLRNLEHFCPIFVDSFLKPTPFGSSHHAFIAENNVELFIKAAKFLKSEFDKDIVICGSWSKEYGDLIIDYHFNRIQNIENVTRFRYALVHCQKDELLEILNREKPEATLF